MDLWNLWDTELSSSQSAEKRAAKEIELMKLLMERHGVVAKPAKKPPRKPLVAAQPSAISNPCTFCGGNCDGPCEFAGRNPFAAGGSMISNAELAEAGQSPSPGKLAAAKKRQAAPSVAEMLMQQLDALESDSLIADQPTPAQTHADAHVHAQHAASSSLSSTPAAPPPPHHHSNYLAIKSSNAAAAGGASGGGADFLSRLASVEGGEPELRAPSGAAIAAAQAALHDTSTPMKRKLAKHGTPAAAGGSPGLATLRAAGEARRKEKQRNMEAKKSASPMNKPVGGRRKPTGTPQQVVAY